MSYAEDLRKVGIDLPNGSRGQRKVKCPRCGDDPKHKGRKDLSVNIEKGLYNCKSASCDFKGHASAKIYKRPDNKFTPLVPRHMKFMDGRGISQGTVDKLQIGVSGSNNIRFNYYRKDTLINFKDRKDLPDGKKTFRQHVEAEHIVYNLNSLEGKTKGIIVEGEMDVASLVECGLDSEYGIISVDQGAGTVGSEMKGKLECISRCSEEINAIKEWIIAVDADGPGEWLAENLIDRLGDMRCKKVNYPEGRKDVNEMLTVKGYDKDINIEGIIKMVKAARWVKAKGIIELDDKVREKMLYHYDHGLPKGLSTGFDGLDPHFTFLAGDLTLTYGIPNYGKSTMERQLMLIQSYLKGARWACYVPEDMPEFLFYEDLCHMYIGKTTDIDYKHRRATKEEYITAMDFVREHFYIMYPELGKDGRMELPTNPWLNERIDGMRVKYGINGYVKDPWNQIYHEYAGREDEYLSQALSAEKFFASDYQYSLYVAHPKTQRLPKDSMVFAEPDPYSISGGSMWYNKIDNMLVVHRPNNNDPDDKLVTLTSKKIKKSKLVGKKGTCQFRFDWESNRYYDLIKNMETGHNPLPGGNGKGFEVAAVFQESSQFEEIGNSMDIWNDDSKLQELDDIDDIPF